MRWLIARARSFSFAGRGLRRLLREPNARVHAVATAMVITLGVLLQVNKTDWLWLWSAISAVWVAEAFNTALELACDAAVPRQDPKIAAAKDVSAAAVLLAALFSVGVGALVLGPHLIAWATGATTGP